MKGWRKNDRDQIEDIVYIVGDREYLWGNHADQLIQYSLLIFRIFIVVVKYL